MSNQIQSPKSQKFDLEERTAHFGESIIEFVKDLPENAINKLLISQLVRSATSIGANYMEADAGESKKDFFHKIGLSKKEAKETLHWLRMISKANPGQIETCRRLWKESHEFVLIFSAIIKRKKSNSI